CRLEGRRGGPLEAPPATCPEKGPPMCRKPLSKVVIAAGLVLSLLPPAPAAPGPAPTSLPHLHWGVLPRRLWGLPLPLLGPATHLKNGIQIDPDGATAAPAPSQGDNRIQIDPNG